VSASSFGLASWIAEIFSSGVLELSKPWITRSSHASCGALRRSAVAVSVLHFLDQIKTSKAYEWF
jgi:hypothetical protein